MIVEAFVAGSDAEQALLEHGLGRVANLADLAQIRQAPVERGTQAAASIDFPEQQQACTGDDMAATKGGITPTTTTRAWPASRPSRFLPAATIKSQPTNKPR